MMPCVFSRKRFATARPFWVLAVLRCLWLRPSKDSLPPPVEKSRWPWKRLLALYAAFLPSLPTTQDWTGAPLLTFHRLNTEFTYLPFLSSELVAQLRASHNQGKRTAGLDIENGEVGDARELSITESFKVKSKVLLSATEAAEMILRVDEIVRSAPRCVTFHRSGGTNFFWADKSS
jgi:hypothetical protein